MKDDLETIPFLKKSEVRLTNCYMSAVWQSHRGKRVVTH